MLIIIGFALLYYFVLPAFHFSEHKQIHQLASTPLWWKLISVVRAAVAEEIVFRGYGFERLRGLSGSTVFAAMASWAIFTVEHLSAWGFGHLLIAGFGGMFLTLLYVWRRNIYAAMIAHFIADLISVIAA
ncbi:MAG: CPBP family intramembrane metalloprotease [Verrucomicrobiota bacterium]|nr:CPBP family intramembrane metalloprotease [Verrucomicrobiota bacterium]